MIESPVKPTVQKKASVQACCGYSVCMFWFQKGSRAKSSALVESTVSVQGVGAMISAEDGSWSSTASEQVVCDWLNRRWRPV
jgi:hypothetical protein